MESKRILIVQGHPDAAGGHLCNALAQCYADAAREAGHALRELDVAQLDFPLLRSAHEWKNGPLPPALRSAQDDIRWCNHLVFVFPLWLGDMPALLKGFLEQVARSDFAFKPAPRAKAGEAAEGAGNPFGRKGLTGRSARIVVTMGMPAFIYRWVFRAHSVKSLERNVLGFVGIAPVRETLIGMVESPGADSKAWFATLRRLGAAGE